MVCVAWTESFVCQRCWDSSVCWSPYPLRRKHKHYAMSVFDEIIIAKYSKRLTRHAAMIAHLKNSVMCEQNVREGQTMCVRNSEWSCLRVSVWVSGVAHLQGSIGVSLIKVCSFGERRQNMSASAFKHCNMEKQGARCFCVSQQC